MAGVGSSYLVTALRASTTHQAGRRWVNNPTVWRVEFKVTKVGKDWP